MRPREDELIDPEIAEQLDAIDATLAGEPVAPRFAELAELALLLSVARPEAPRPEFAAELDRRVESRFGRAAAAPAASSAGARPAGGRSRWWHSWSLAPVLGSAAAAVVVAVVLVNLGGGTGSSTGTFSALSGSSAPSPRKSAPVVAARGLASTSGQGGSGGGSQNAASPAKVILGSVKTVHSAAGVKAAAPPAPAPPALLPAGTIVNQSAQSSVQAAPETFSPAPLPNGRKIVQSSILQLGAPANRIDAVAQEVFDVVGAVNGIVDSSNVSSTGGPGASAQFQLRIPSAQLPLALTDLSRLHYAHVLSRTDNTRDINSSFVSTQRHIADTQAALARLRTQLAAATLSTQIASLKAQIAADKATLAAAQTSLGSLNRQVDYSRVVVSIQATPSTGGGKSGGGGGFGLHKAGHDALRVLEVTAGVALIALAVLVPVGLMAALAWWLAGTVQRRRRERALDLA
jgi:hypothetical protein